MEHVGSLESTKEAQELPAAIAEGNSSFLRREKLQCFQIKKKTYRWHFMKWSNIKREMTADNTSPASISPAKKILKKLP